ncbi:hypothetical protein GCM10010471_07080 [Leucobacter komagatae]|nr:hypothetical protein [Leucobacter komagatae]
MVEARAKSIGTPAGQRTLGPENIAHIALHGDLDPVDPVMDQRGQLPIKLVEARHVPKIGALGKGVIPHRCCRTGHTVRIPVPAQSVVTNVLEPLRRDIMLETHSARTKNIDLFIDRCERLQRLRHLGVTSCLKEIQPTPARLGGLNG